MDTYVIPFRDLAYVAIAAITGGLVAWRLRQPVIIGYVLAGNATGSFRWSHHQP
jgi:Kef-type K+ transport system membrane component KefB